MHWLLVVEQVALIVWSVLATVLAYVYRKRAHNQEMADAKRAQTALIGGTPVDGIELPLPTDDRWKIEEAQDTGTKRNLVLLAIAGVCVSDEAIFVGDRSRGSVRAQPVTPAAKQYVQDVWTAYRNRIARKAIENG